MKKRRVKKIFTRLNVSSGLDPSTPFTLALRQAQGPW